MAMPDPESCQDQEQCQRLPPGNISLGIFIWRLAGNMAHRLTHGKRSCLSNWLNRSRNVPFFFSVAFCVKLDGGKVLLFLKFLLALVMGSILKENKIKLQLLLTRCWQPFVFIFRSVRSF